MKDITGVSFCPHCSNNSPQKVIKTQLLLEDSFSMDGDISKGDFPCTYYITICEICGGILIYEDEGCQLTADEQFYKSELCWPDFGIKTDAVPKSVMKYYEEALLVKGRSPDSFAVQIRRSLEAICKDRGTNENSTLNDRLKELADRGEFPPTIISLADNLRFIGNIGAHDAEFNVKPGFVRLIDDLFKVIVEYVYIAPKKLADFEETIKKFKNK